MKNKDTSTIATALSWIEGPEFVESSERLASSLISSFPLSKIEALTIVLIEAMCNHNVIDTKKKIREVLTCQFGIKLTDADKKASEHLFDICCILRLIQKTLSRRNTKQAEDIPYQNVRNCDYRLISQNSRIITSNRDGLHSIPNTNDRYSNLHSVHSWKEVRQPRHVSSDR